MALINHRSREIHFKIVYVGPGLGGKTTNLQSLHDRLPPERRGKLVSISTDHERTLFFDFLPIDLGEVNGFKTRFHLYTVPGQVYYRLSRRAVLQGVDGVVFVADSHPAREQANRESLEDTRTHLATLGLSESQVRLPWIFQYNKRDLPLAIGLERMRALLNANGAPEFEAVANQGRGVTETLRAACKAVLARLAGTASDARMAVPPHAAAIAAATTPPQPAALRSKRWAGTARTAETEANASAPGVEHVPPPNTASTSAAPANVTPPAPHVPVPSAVPAPHVVASPLPPRPAEPAPMSPRPFVPSAAPQRFAPSPAPPQRVEPTAAPPRLMPSSTAPRPAFAPAAPHVPAAAPAPARPHTPAAPPALSPTVNAPASRRPTTPPERPFMPRPRIQTAPRRNSPGGGFRA
jgi:signal recognition particle receptor subunit beta